MLLALLLASFLQVSALNLRERAMTIPVKTAGATYTWV